MADPRADILAELNDAQRQAVRAVSGPVLILAGAGSGKTKTLTHRIAHILTSQSIRPSQILAVTFTNKAAREMRQRLAQLLGRDAADRSFMPWMGTFHSICVRLLRADGQAIGVPRRFVIYDEDDRRGVVRQAMKARGLTDKDIKPQAVASALSAAKNKLLDPEAYEAQARYPYQQTIAALYSDYERLRRQAQALDFDDLLLEAVRLLRDQPAIRQVWQQQFAHILVDEYQDTNAAQYQLIKLLTNQQQNLCVVGDDWQSIYSWRGADVTNILHFERDFPGALVVKLEQNYRSTGAILAAAQQVISKNTERSHKSLWTAAGPGKPVTVTMAYDEAEEAAQVADQIAAQVAIGARQYDQYAVLYRTNAQSYSIERALRQRAIPAQLVGGVRFFDRAVVKDVMAYLRLCYQPQDTASLTRIINLPPRGVGAVSLAKFLAWQQQTGLDIVSALTQAAQATTITGRARMGLVNLGEALRAGQVAMQRGDGPAAIIEGLATATGYRDHINDGSAQAEERLENLGVLLSEAATYADIETFLEEAALMSSIDTAADGQAVTLMTLHAAKGLEFPVVYMVGMEEGILPHARVSDGALAELEEERRLCYVGMTRARQELHLSYAASRLQFGQRLYHEPSRFLRDMGDTVSGAPGQLAVDAVDSEPDYWSDELALASGDRVRSARFGVGTVHEVDGLAVVVNFDNGTAKKLNAEFARLEKID